MCSGRLFLLSVFLSTIFVIAKGLDFTEKDLSSDEHLWNLYEKWRAQHTVSRDLTDKDTRFNVFKANVHRIHEANQMGKAYKLRLNKFADMTIHEFRSSYSSKVIHNRMIRGSPAATRFMHEKTDNIPDSVDWRKKGAVTTIKNQGNCGSCWAFSTVVGVEGINQIKTGKLVILSEQELIDCDKENQGCNGGLMELAYEFIKKQGGLPNETEYPYQAEDMKCDAIKESVALVKIDGHENVPKNDENSLTKAVANQPVSVAIDAGSSDMQFYSEGVFTGQCGTELDHGVAVVGYGETTDGIKYWIVKNSWGSEWGEEGYIRLQRGIDAKEGLCGIAMEASYPIKNSEPAAKDEL